MNTELADLLKDFRSKHGFSGKGPLCVAIVVTQHARKSGLPLDSSNLLTEGGGQVLGMGKNAVQAVLSRHGITKILAQEGGRTSRGSIGNMREYVSFINALNEKGLCDLEGIEHFWIDRVHEYFSAKPFSIKLDASKSLRSIVKDLVKQAEDRQKKNPGMQYAGAVLQHIVGAKLSCAMGADGPSHNSFSTSASQTNRAGDFLFVAACNDDRLDAQ
ncbi:MAG: DUF4928 family protein [Acidiphilium sp.]|nr:DUF4928 family protein [Acidiphilium sp.]MDD4937094.1 DUF4928 family protein [Acidiphilium sp.]